MPVSTIPATEAIISTMESHAYLGSITTDQGALPLRSVGIHAHIDQLFAQVTVKQGYSNPHDTPIEATYIFPLPDRAAVTRFQARLGDRLVEGVLKERAQARQEYDEAIEQGHRAAIAEEERSNVFTMRVGNIMPGESAEVELTLTMPLAYEEGEATFRFPLVVAPRYIPGNPLDGESVGLGTAHDTDAVPDASRITPPILLPGYPYPVQLDIDVSLASSIKPVVNLPVTAVDHHETTTRWKVQTGQKLDRDFLFRFPVASSTVTTSLQIAPDDKDPSRGTLSLTIVPPKQQNAGTMQKPRRLVFVLDRSGSMDSWKMVAARRALGRMIDTLSVHDHFAILAFDDSVESFPSATDIGAQKWFTGQDTQRFRAIEALASIHSRGGTEMQRPLTQAATMLQEKSSEQEDRIMVLITDGQVGNEDQILRSLQPLLKNIRIFTLGVDMAVNEGFLRRLAQLGGGITELVESEERLDEVMQRIHRRIASPVLRNLSWKVDGLKLEADSTVPDNLTDLFAEAPVIFQARCLLPAEGSLIVSATDEAGQPWQQTVKPVVAPSPVLATCWARSKVRALEDAYASGKDNSTKATQAITDLSLKYGVLCRFTAFVAVDRSSIVNPGEKPRCIIQAVEIPAGWDSLNDSGNNMKFSLNHIMCASAPTPNHYMSTEVMYDRSFDHEDNSRHSFHELRNALFWRHSDTSSYRQRAEELASHYESAINNKHEPTAALGLLGMKLQELIDDLRSINAPEAEIKALVDLKDAIKQCLEQGNAAGIHTKDILQVLRAFAGVRKAKPSFLKRLQFWK